MLTRAGRDDDFSEIVSRRTVDAFSDFIMRAKPSSVLVLCDEDFQSDRRIQSQVEAVRSSGVRCDIRDIRNFADDARTGAGIGSMRAALQFAVLAIGAGVLNLGRFRDIERSWGLSAYRLPWADWRLHSLNDVSSVFTAAAFANGYKGTAPDLVIANNLIGLLIGTFMAGRFGSRVFYDSHEITIFRNRETVTRLRNFLAFALERYASRFAGDIATVNKPCASILADVTGRDDIEIIYNDHYRNSPVLKPEQRAADFLGVLFVGSAAPGRRLDLVGELLNTDAVDKASFFLCGDRDRQARMIGTEMAKTDPGRYSVRHGVDYDEALGAALRNGGGWFSWIVLEDLVPSYNLSLPNKFFQSVSSALPIVCQEGSYLAEIVRRYDIGVVLPAGCTAGEAGAALKAALADYGRIHGNVHRARSMILSGG